MGMHHGFNHIGNPGLQVLAEAYICGITGAGRGACGRLFMRKMKVLWLYGPGAPCGKLRHALPE